jgi:GNAT superfamily N-acetyltransferase
MLSAVHVRALRRADLAACLDMAQLVKSRDGYPPRGPVDVGRFFAPPQELAAWVADVGSAVVGHIALHSTGADVTMTLGTRHTGKPPEQLALVARLLVGPAARHRGVGRALLAVAVADALGRGRQPILDVATHFDAAIGLYESCGWDRAGEVTIELSDEPSLQCYVYIGPAPGQDDGGPVTRP